MADLRPVTQADLPGLSGLLRRNIETSMFPLANLQTHGLGGDDARSITGWCLPDHSGALFVTNEGMAMPQLPGAGGALRMPATDGLTLQRPIQDDAALLTAWRAAAHVETLDTPEDEARDQTARDVKGYIDKGMHRILRDRGQPVAMTGFNAVVEDCVQIGAVFTPPDLRNRSHARAALALHLAEARAEGTARAVLFAASESAVRAYLALGFDRFGDFSLILFAGPQQVRP